MSHPKLFVEAREAPRLVLSLPDINKAKYTKRTGSPGNYKYYYEKDSSGKVRTDAAEAKHKKVTQQPSDKKLSKLKQIVSEHQHAKIEGQIVDATTASMLVKVADALNETNRAKFLSLPIGMMADIGWSLVSKSQTGPHLFIKVGS